MPGPGDVFPGNPGGRRDVDVAANGFSHNPLASGTIPGYFSAGVRPAAFLSVDP